MKKVVLSLAFVAVMFVSCKENAAEGDVVVDSTSVEVEVPVIETEETVVDTATVEVPVTTTTTTEVEAAPVK